MIAYLFSCEHATCAVPEAFREVFRGSEERLVSPDGWEPGALNLAQAFSMKFRTQLVHGDVTRLLIDLDQDGDARWGEFSSKLPEATQAKLIDRHERPYRALLKQRINEDLIRHSAVVHVRVHTSPSEGEVILKTAPEHLEAGKFADEWRARLEQNGISVRRGSEDLVPGLGMELVRSFPADRYVPVTLEVSQSFFLEGKPLRWDTLKKALLGSFGEAVSGFQFSAPESPSSH
jgi:hypothetical protein